MTHSSVAASKNKFKDNMPLLTQPKYFGKLIDGLVILSFILLLSAFVMGRIGNSFSRMTTLTDDAANIASFAASLDHPELFAKDPLLSNQNNFAFYFTVHVPLLRLLYRAFDNYGTAFITLLFPALLLQLIGFYYLGNVLYRNRFWAFLLAVVTIIPTYLPPGEFWGFHKDPLPRVTFQALLPFLLGVAIKHGGQAKFWPWIMGGAGLLVYVHPVSAPAWGVAILLGLWFSAPTLSIWQRFKKAFLSGIVFLLVIAPFAVNYLMTFFHSQSENYEQVFKILSYRFMLGYLDLPLALKMFYEQVIASSLVNKGIWLWAGVGFGLATYLNRKKLAENRLPYILASWWIGLLLISVVVPVTEHEILKRLHRTPLEFDLIRGLRYSIPLLWIVSFWALSEIHDKLRERVSSAPSTSARLLALATVVLGVGMTVAWGGQKQFITDTDSTFTCWAQGTFTCPEVKGTGRADFLDAVRDLTPQGSSIFFPDLVSQQVKDVG